MCQSEGVKREGVNSEEKDKDILVVVAHNHLISLYIQSQELSIYIHNKFWESEAPSKVLVFSWRLLLDTLPSCELLHKQ